MKQNEYACFKPHVWSEAQEWIRSTHGKTFKIKNKDQHETTVPI